MLTMIEIVSKHLAGSAEIGRMLGGISRQRVQVLINRPDFPEPYDELTMGKVWTIESVTEWARAHGREIANDAD